MCRQCEKLLNSNKLLKSELDSISKLSFHLEKRTQEQEDLIALLKQSYNGNCLQNNSMGPSASVEIKSIKLDLKQNADNGNSTNAKKTISEVAKTNSLSGKTVSTEKRGAEGKTQTNINNHRISPYKHQGNKYKPIIGSNEDDSIKTISKKGYLHVYRI